jgi:anti-anti-sigma factor
VERQNKVGMSDKSDATPTFVLRGRLDAETVAGVEAELLRVVAETDHHLVIDAKALDYISSAGLRAVLMAIKRMRAKGGGLSITGMRAAVREVMDLTGITTLLSPPPA